MKRREDMSILRSKRRQVLLNARRTEEPVDTTPEIPLLQSIPMLQTNPEIAIELINAHLYRNEYQDIADIFPVLPSFMQLLNSSDNIQLKTLTLLVNISSVGACADELAKFNYQMFMNTFIFHQNTLIRTRAIKLLTNLIHNGNTEYQNLKQSGLLNLLEKALNTFNNDASLWKAITELITTVSEVSDIYTDVSMQTENVTVNIVPSGPITQVSFSQDVTPQNAFMEVFPIFAKLFSRIGEIPEMYSCIAMFSADQKAMEQMDDMIPTLFNIFVDALASKNKIVCTSAVMLCMNIVDNVCLMTKMISNSAFYSNLVKACKLSDVSSFASICYITASIIKTNKDTAQYFFSSDLISVMVEKITKIDFEEMDQSVTDITFDFSSFYTDVLDLVSEDKKATLLLFENNEPVFKVLACCVERNSMDFNCSLARNLTKAMAFLIENDFIDSARELSEMLEESTITEKIQSVGMNEEDFAQIADEYMKCVTFPENSGNSDGV
ncbi:hypothetical protein EIN_490870 [Entamoeba invadens IP1]|uniref:Uncharacterized protein n=1 Tax=Entamoeba invadens IP1 TaxID=370355 RepID=A0A0A1U3Y0_ENTIV|nr:hypothetical protein EIN_490870 [Entamoeba invadens IP1]ELP88948.1 hypothetical protein EIN_490870 [Entamoeba invadens IP1]|eukprot:XP_004255719.1 hypothetical protein EIN_490870 [Entamoeba invadens IP1]